MFVRMSGLLLMLQVLSASMILSWGSGKREILLGSRLADYLTKMGLLFNNFRLKRGLRWTMQTLLLITALSFPRLRCMSLNMWESWPGRVSLCYIIWWVLVKGNGFPYITSWFSGVYSCQVSQSKGDYDWEWWQEVQKVCWERFVGIFAQENEGKCVQYIICD